MDRWAALALGGFLVGLFVVPTAIWFWPAPSYYSDSFQFADVRIHVAVRFQANGPIAAGNPIYAGSFLFVVWCPPWNVTSLSVWIQGYNASASGSIAIPAFPVQILDCRFLDGGTNPGVLVSGDGSGSVVFYGSGRMPVIMGLSVGHVGGSYTNVSDTFPSDGPWTPKNTVPVEPSETLYSFQNIRLLAIAIVAGGMLAGWMSTIESVEKYWKRLRPPKTDGN